MWNHAKAIDTIVELRKQIAVLEESQSRERTVIKAAHAQRMRDHRAKQRGDRA